MSQLEAVETEATSEAIIEFKTEELTAHCPFDFGGPDFYTLIIRYRPDRHTIESRSLKIYLENYRDEELTVEDAAQTIYDDVTTTINPDSAYIRLEQNIRGGIAETVEVGDTTLRKN